MSHDQYDFLKELKMCLHKLARRHVGNIRNANEISTVT